MDAARVTPLAQVGRFLRLSVLGFSLLLPLGGAATVSTDVSALQVAVLLGVAFAFHVFGYVSNDVCDLVIDRTEPLRAGSPLVRGLISPRLAFAIAMIPVPLAALLHLLAGRSPIGAMILLAGMAFGWIYNAYGKRLRWPLVSDAVQALAWIALAWYGAVSVAASFRATLTMPFAYFAATVFVYVLMINGLHGGLRDLANDKRHGAMTTAIFLGAHVDDHGRLIIPKRVALYGLALHIALPILGIAAVARRWPNAAIAIVILHAALLMIARKALRATDDRKQLVMAGFAHLFLSLGAVFLPFALFGNLTVAATMIAVYAVPVMVLGIRMTRRALFPGFAPARQ